MGSVSVHRDYSITVPCAHHGSHGPYDFTGRDDIVIRNSKALGHRFETGEHHISFDYLGRGYSCSTLSSIIKTWKDQEYHPPQDVEDLEVLFQLSKALWEYKCDLKWFEGFADAVKTRHWKNHFQQGGRSKYWAFIALVFGWREVFGLASMDIPSLGELPGLHHPRQDEDEVLRKIIGVYDYREQCTQTYDFIRNTCCKLEEGHRKVSERIRNYFKAKNLKILTVEEDNIEHIRKYGVVGLLRIFERCLQDPWAAQPERGSNIPTGNRFTRIPTIWKSASAVARRLRNEKISAKHPKDKWNPIKEDLLSKIQEHQKSNLNLLLERKPIIRQRFTSFRNANLILTDEIGPRDETSSVPTVAGELPTPSDTSWVLTTTPSSPSVVCPLDITCVKSKSIS